MARYPYRILKNAFDRVFRNDLNKNFEDIEVDIRSQTARVDNLINSVEQPSEVVDARTDKDGIVYPVLKERLDTEQHNIETELLNHEDRIQQNSDDIAVNAQNIHTTSQDLNSLITRIGKNEDLNTQQKESLVLAINEVYEYTSQNSNSIDEAMGRLDDFSMALDKKADVTDIAEYSILSYGADNTGVEDITAIFNDLVASIPEGSKIVFPRGVYKGNFILNKSLILDFQESTLINAKDDEDIIRFSGTFNDPVEVIGNPNFMDRSFTVSSSAGLSEGDIGYLVDDSIRASDNTPGINKELIKIDRIEGNEIFVTDMIRSNMLNGSVRFVKVNPVKWPRIENAVIKPTESHMANGVFFEGCEFPTWNNVTVEGFAQHAIRHDYCYGILGTVNKSLNPRLTDSGQGYGVSMRYCRIGSVWNVYGEGTRHILDIDSSYFCGGYHVEDPKAAGLPVYLSHNGYGGYNFIDGLRARVNTALVSCSRQGIENEDNNVMRGYVIRNVEGIIPDTTNADTFYGIYFQSDYADITIKNINIKFLNPVGDPNGANNVAVRFAGNQRGNVTIDGVTVNRIGSIVRAETRGTSYGDKLRFSVKNLTAYDELVHALFFRGIQNISIGAVNVVNTNTALRSLFRIQGYLGLDVWRVHFESSDISYVNNMFEIDGIFVSGLRGSFPEFNESTTATYKLSSNEQIDEERTLTGAKLIRIDSGTDGSTVTLNAAEPIAPPLWMGQTIRLLVIIGRNNVVIPVGGTVRGESNITLVPNKIYEFVGYSGVWYLKE